MFLDAAAKSPPDGYTLLMMPAADAVALNTPEVKETFMRQGQKPAPGTPEAFGEFIRSEIADNVKLVKAAGIKVE